MLSRAVRCSLLLIVVLAGIPASASAGSWTRVAGQLPTRNADIRPSDYRAYGLDRATLRERLAQAPSERSGDAGVVLAVPGPRGLERFRVVESPVMEPGLARLHPGIKTYAGRGVDEPTATIRLDLTPAGFHAAVHSAAGRWYVDPYYRGADTVHVAYYGRDLADDDRIVQKPPIPPSTPARERLVPAQTPGEFVIQREYRLALISDPEYAAYHAPSPDATDEQIDDAVTAAKVTLMNRVNQLYNDDLAIRLLLVAQNDRVNFNDDLMGFHGPDPARPQCGLACYPGVDDAEPGAGTGTGEACDPQTLVQNNNVADLLIGDGNYDIGHIVLGEPGGGVALLGAVGDPTVKASGCTGLPTPTGDYFAVDYVAHEMGHQFGGNHTFNGTQYNCAGGNRNAETSVEPGSGSTVMGYAGICRQDDLQPHSDPYFSQRSIDEIESHIADDGDEETTNEGDPVTTTNRSPVVSAPAARTIPIRTPFTLSGSATDGDGDTPVFLWEQNDPGGEDGTPLVSNQKTDGPLFRVFGRAVDISPEAALLYPSPGENTATPADATRTFPDPAQLAIGNTNAASGGCPEVSIADPDDADAPKGEPLPIRECYSEFLPTAPRTLNFRLTARDLYEQGGGVSHADTVVTVAGDAPFRVTSQSGPVSAAGGSSLPVTWDVAGTNANPFGVSAVRISYSTDGGLTFPTVLAQGTPNDGAEGVTLPNVATTTGRIKVEAVGNFFFDISRGDLTVTPSVAPVATTSTATPALNGILRPDLSRVSKRLRASKTRRVKLRLRCSSAGTFAVPARCRGTVRISARLGRKTRRIGRRSFDFGLTETRTVTVRLTRSAYRRLRGRSLRATIRASVVSPGRGTQTASKRMRLVRRSR